MNNGSLDQTELGAANVPLNVPLDVLQAQPPKPLSTRILADSGKVPLTDAAANTVNCSDRQGSPSAALRGRRHRQGPANNPPAWRSLSASSLAEIVKRFESTEVACGEDARGVLADFSAAEHRLRLHAVVWTEPSLLTSELDSGLSLLLVLSPIANGYLPLGTELTITESNLLHSGQNLRWTSDPACLYTQVFGDWEKQFTVRVTLPNGISVTLPPLTFSQP